MTRRKKILIGLASLLVVVLVAGYFIGNVILDRATREVMTKVVALGGEQGLEIESPGFEAVGLTGLHSAKWSGLTGKIKLPEGADSASRRMWDVQVASMWVRHSFVGDSLVMIDQVTITSNENPGPDDHGLASTQRVINLSDIECRCSLSVLDPGTSLRTVLPEIVSLLAASEFQLPLQLDGSLSFVLKDEPTVLGIEVAQRDGGSALRLRTDDVAKLSSRFDEALTRAEVQLIADDPLRAARLLEIKDSAETDSREAHQQDDTVPEDAYRHVLWSYLLASTYGEEFAKRVGDAHEAGDTGNTPAERAMDYHNNEIGRNYAQLEFKRNTILRRVLNDSDVRREP